MLQEIAEKFSECGLDQLAPFEVFEQLGGGRIRIEPDDEMRPTFGNV